VRIPPRALDVLFAAVSAVLTTLVLLDSGIAAASDQSITGDRWWVAPLILVPSVALLFRRTHPLATIAGVWVPVALQAQITGDGGEGLYLVWPAWVSLYALAAYGTRRQLLIGIPLALVCLAVHDLNDPLNWRTAEGAWSAAWWDLVLFVPALVGGIVAGSRRTRQLAVEKALAEAQARAAVAEERARIARELHDVIGHSISVMGVQAGAVRRVLPPELAEERETLQSVERTGRDAVTEMRRLLDLLRSAGEAPSGALPTLTLTPQLIADMRHAGLGVELEIDGELEDVPPGLALAAYRIVQEALTNALKHAPDARVRVAVRRTAGQLEVEVLQEPSERVSAEREGPGHGLVGMHERVALYGGRLAVGPGSDGGFEVRATLPLQAAGA
jgi:signal transduction histidine kinase